MGDKMFKILIEIGEIIINSKIVEVLINKI